MAVFDDINVRDNRNIRKALAAAAFVAPMSASPITEITDTDGSLLPIPTEYKAFGWITEDGIAWPRETEASDIYGLGSSEPARTDIRRSTKRVTVTAMETNIVTLQAYLGIDLSSATTGSNGETSFDEPELAAYPYQRLLVIAKDINDGGEYYRGRQFLRSKVTEVGEEQWQDGDTPAQYPLTLTAFQDPDAGTGVRHFLGGPGRSSTEEGFPAPGS